MFFTAEAAEGRRGNQRLFWSSSAASALSAVKGVDDFTAEVAEETVRRSDFQQAMMTREEFVVGQAEVRFVASADQEGVGLGEAKDAALIRSCQNS